MQNLRSVAIAAAGIVVLAIAAAFTVSLTLIAGAVLTLTLAARMLTARPKKAPAARCACGTTAAERSSIFEPIGRTPGKLTLAPPGVPVWPIKAFKSARFSSMACGNPELHSEGRV